MGEIKGEGSSSIVEYVWFLLNPRIEIKEDGDSFFAQIRIKGDNNLVPFRVTWDVIGDVSITYDKDENILDIKVIKADVVLDVIGNIDIAKHFTKSLKLDGPQGIAEEVEFKLPSGKIRKMSVEVVSYNLKLIEDAVKVSTSLGFKTVEWF